MPALDDRRVDRVDQAVNPAPADLVRLLRGPVEITHITRNGIVELDRKVKQTYDARIP